LLSFHLEQETALVRVFALSLASVPSLLAAQSQPLPLKYTPRPTSAAISAGDLMSRLYAFADDSMMGRETGTRGHVMSTDYIARELRRLGLEPAGDHKTYFQSVPMVNRPFDVARSSLSVNGATLAAGTDFVPQTFRGMPRAIDGAPVIFGGAYGDTAGLPSAEQLRGRIVVFAGGRSFGSGAFSGAVSGAAAIVRVASPRMLAQTLRSATRAGPLRGCRDRRCRLETGRRRPHYCGYDCRRIYRGERDFVQTTSAPHPAFVVKVLTLGGRGAWNSAGTIVGRSYNSLA
jgi:hypothetical protein